MDRRWVVFSSQRRGELARSGSGGGGSVERLGQAAAQWRVTTSDYSGGGPLQALAPPRAPAPSAFPTVPAAVPAARLALTR